MYTEIPGHHFVDGLYLFMTLHERFPSDKYRSVSTEFSRRWIVFANGLPPWTKYDMISESVAIVDEIQGWKDMNRIDYELASGSYCGMSRVKAWEIAAEILAKQVEQAPMALRQMQAKSLIALTKV